jgi:hypothetical protein
MSNPEAFSESLRLRKQIIQEQSRQAVATHKVGELQKRIEDMKIEIELWESIYAHSQFKINALNELVRVGGI